MSTSPRRDVLAAFLCGCAACALVGFAGDLLRYDQPAVIVASINRRPRRVPRRRLGHR